MKVSAWRCRSAEDNRGILVYFDPFLEDISIRVLTAPERSARLTQGLACAQLNEDEEIVDNDYDQLHIELNA